MSEILRKPDWIRVKLRVTEDFKFVDQLLTQKRLNTVCEEAHCPNMGECWAHRTATFLILGDTCTRNCRFCNVATGRPAPPPTAPRPSSVGTPMPAVKLPSDAPPTAIPTSRSGWPGRCRRWG